MTGPPASNRDPYAEDIALYRAFLIRQIETIQPKVVITLGRFSMEFMLEQHNTAGAICPHLLKHQWFNTILKGSEAMEVFSSAFDSGESIPDKYTCQGDNISPPLGWRDLPQGAQSLALIFDDPDSSNGPFSHWVLYNIPVDVQELREGLDPRERLSWGGIQGRNDFGKTGYGGPCPRLGETHTYYLRLYALEVPCDLMPGATRAQLIDWMQDRIVGQSELIGRYSQVE